MTRFDYIDKNMEQVRDLVKNGFMNPSVITHYHVAKSFKECKGISSVMQRYTEVANAFNLKEFTVRIIVSDMKKPFRK